MTQLTQDCLALQQQRIDDAWRTLEGAKRDITTLDDVDLVSMARRRGLAALQVLVDAGQVEADTDFISVGAMNARLDYIQSELCYGNVSKKTADILAEEAAEIYVYLDRNNALIEDYADYRREQKCGVGL